MLEFLIKNGSERVIDDARSHLSLLKMLRQFHYIDQNGKDQGVNVRNRSKELAELLSDVDRIRTERKKARANRNKFGGVEGGASTSGMSGGSRYGGFGSEDAGYGGYSGGVYGDGGGFGGRDSSYQDTSARRERFEEYDEYDEASTSTSVRRRPDTSSREVKKPDPPKAKEPAVDFLSFEDDVPPKTPPKDFSTASKNPLTALNNDLSSLSASQVDDDDFDDFQSATPTTTASSKPSVPPASFANISAPPTLVSPQIPNQGSSAGLTSHNSTSGSANSLNSHSVASTPNYNISSPPAPNYNISMSSPPPQQSKPPISPQPQTQPQIPKSTSYQAATPNYFTSVQVSQQSQSSLVSTPASSRPSVPSNSSFTATKPGTSKPSASGGDAFGSLWSSASSGAGIKKSTSSGAQGPNLASLQREKASQGIWGHSTAPASTSIQGPGTKLQPAPVGGGLNGSQKNTGGGALDDLLG